MNFLRTPFKILPNGEEAKTFPFHISTKGQENRVIFKDEEDLRVVHNFIPICARRSNVIVFMDCELPTHIHAGILARSYKDAEHFGESLKISYSKYHAYKYGRDIMIFRGVDSKPTYLEDNRHLRNTICYIPRNSLDVGIRVEEYPWSGYRALFCGGQIKCSATPLSSLSARESRRIFMTGDKLKDTGWLINKNGLLEPASYCDWKYAEGAFDNDIKFFMKVLGCSDDAQMEQEMVKDRFHRKTASELILEIEKRCLNKYNRPLSMLTDGEKIPLIKSIYFSCCTSVPQLARCFGLKRDFIEWVLEQ